MNANDGDASTSPVDMAGKIKDLASQISDDLVNPNEGKLGKVRERAAEIYELTQELENSLKETS